MRPSILTSKRAKSLRRAMTEPEVMLWSRLRMRQPDSPIFRRQHPLGPYILDFYCPAAKLAVEIDGQQHGLPDQAAHDAYRDAWLLAAGVEVYRIPAVEVYADLDGAADGVIRLACERTARR